MFAFNVPTTVSCDYDVGMVLSVRFILLKMMGQCNIQEQAI